MKEDTGKRRGQSRMQRALTDMALCRAGFKTVNIERRRED
jgi:hypothetical protein